MIANKFLHKFNFSSRNNFDYRKKQSEYNKSMETTKNKI